jgi:STE24 endopeptidase
MDFTIVTWIYATLFLVRQVWEISLNRMNTKYIRSNSVTVPDDIKEYMDADVFHKSVKYDIESSNFSLVSRIYDALIHWSFILVGFRVLDYWVRSLELNEYWTGLIFIGIFGLIHLLLELPFSIWNDFVLENKYGFNRKTPGVFISDFFKGILVSLLVGAPLLVLLLYLMKCAGPLWWIWAFLGMGLFQVTMLWIYPVLIAPLFNKFTPLTGDLADAIKEQTHRIGFSASGVFTMDGSKRSSHSNAYFTGLGKSKRIVFYDTLIEKMSQEQILSVLGHEMGHSKLGHVRRMLMISQASLLFFLWFLAYLKDLPILYPGFGFPSISNYAALLIFSMLFTETIYPFQFLITFLSRRQEFAADQFAVRVTGMRDPLIQALINLQTENLSNPLVHPVYAAYYYSHPKLVERIKAIRSLPQVFLQEVFQVETHPRNAINRDP